MTEEEQCVQELDAKFRSKKCAWAWVMKSLDGVQTVKSGYIYKSKEDAAKGLLIYLGRERKS